MASGWLLVLGCDLRLVERTVVDHHRSGTSGKPVVLRRLIPILLMMQGGWAETLEDAVRALGRRVLTRLVSHERLSMQTRALPPILANERDRVERGLREALAAVRARRYCGPSARRWCEDGWCCSFTFPRSTVCARAFGTG